MRTSVILVSLLGILTGYLGITSPVPESRDDLEISDSINIDVNNDSGSTLKTRDTATVNPIYGRNGEGRHGGERQEWEIEDCFHRELNCHFRTEADKTEAREVLAGHNGSMAANALDFAADPKVEGRVSSTCTKVNSSGTILWKCFRDDHAVIIEDSGIANVVAVKDGEIDGLAASDAGYKPEPRTSLAALFARQLVDPIPEVMSKPCAKAIITRWGHTVFNTLSIEEKKALWNAIIDCIYGPSDPISNTTMHATTNNNTGSQEAGGIKQLQERESSVVNAPSEQACMKNVITGWTGDLSTEEDQAALMLAVEKCAGQLHQALRPRGVNDFDPVKTNECMKKVKESWTGDFSTEEDRNAFMLAVMSCVEVMQTPSTDGTSSLDKRDECNMSYNNYYFWAFREVAVYVLRKQLDLIRFKNRFILDDMIHCVGDVIDLYHQKCIKIDSRVILDTRIKICWFSMFFYGGPGCSKENPCRGCGRDQPPHICP